MGDSITTPQLRDLLKRHYIKPGAPLPGGVFLPEVGWNGGNSMAGGCDAIYVGFTSTSGRILVGHELKVSRADWLNELNKPGKADGWADQCHEWWLVVSDPTFVHDGELPAGWGLMSPGTSKTRMKVHQKPDRKPSAHCPSWQAVRSIMARQDTLRAQAISDIRRDADREAYADLDKRVDERVAQRLRSMPNAEAVQQKLTAVEKALGYRIDYTSDKHSYGDRLSLKDLAVVGKAALEARNLKDALRYISDGYQIGGIRRHLESLEQAIANLRALEGAQMELA